MQRKAAVEISLIQLIGLVLAVALVIGFGWFFAKMLGIFTTTEEKSAEVSFNSLTAKINELINDPAPLAFTTMPYFLGAENGLVGHRGGQFAYRGCDGIDRTPGFPSAERACQGSDCVCLYTYEAGRDEDEFPTVLRCSSTKEYKIYFDYLTRNPVGGDALGTAFTMVKFPRGNLVEPAKKPDHPTGTIFNVDTYGLLKYLVFVGDCNDHKFSQQRIYLEKHEVINNQKIILIGIPYDTAGLDSLIERRTANILKEATAHHLDLAARSAPNWQDVMRIMQRLLTYPKITSDDWSFQALRDDMKQNRLRVSSALCDYSSNTPNHALTRQHCEQTLQLMTDEEKQKAIRVKSNLAFALVELGDISQGFTLYLPILSELSPQRRQHFEGIADRDTAGISDEELLRMAREYARLNYNGQARKLYARALSRSDNAFIQTALIEFVKLLRIQTESERAASMDIIRRLKSSQQSRVRNMAAYVLFSLDPFNREAQAEGIPAGEQLLREELAPEVRSAIAYDLARHFDGLTARNERIRQETRRRALEFYMAFSQVPDHRYFEGNLRIIELTLQVEGPARAEVIAREIINEYNQVADAQPNFPPQFQQKYARVKEERNGQLQELTGTFLTIEKDFIVDRILSRLQSQRKATDRLSGEMRTALKQANSAYTSGDFENAVSLYGDFFANNPLDTTPLHILHYIDAACKASESFFSKAQRENERCVTFGDYCLAYGAGEIVNRVRGILPNCEVEVETST